MEGEETDALRKRRLVEAAALEALDERKKDSSLKTTSSTAVSEKDTARKRDEATRKRATPSRNKRQGQRDDAPS